jgi:NDP-sugar pyrophosphorylase family protein
MRNFRAMILAAGMGTRLMPLTRTMPKPLVPIGDAPAIVRAIQSIHAVLPAPIVINTFHASELLAGALATQNVALLHETELLGTAGGLHNARALFDDADDVLVWNGDIRAAPDLRALIDAHSRGEALGRAATLLVRERRLGEGNVGFTNDGTIVRLRQEQFGPEHRSGEFVGIHSVGAKLRKSLPALGCLVSDLYLPYLRQGGALGVCCTEMPFLDIGTIASYAQANWDWLRQQNLPEYIHHRAMVSADTQGCIIGADAVIEAVLERCIVWPGTVVRTPRRNAILTPTDTIEL